MHRPEAYITTYRAGFSSITRIYTRDTISVISGSSKYTIRNGDIEEKAENKPKYQWIDCNGNLINTKKDTQTKLSLDCAKIAPRYTLNKRKVKAKCYAFSTSRLCRQALYFYTVTFPKNTPDEEAYRIWNIYWTRVRKEFGVQHYIWIAERQKNNTIHFHYLTPNYTPIREVNQYAKAAIITGIERGNIPCSMEVASKYNGVHIAKNNSGRITNFAKGNSGKYALTGYLTKYITKNDTAYSRLVWHCSRSISILATSIGISEVDAKEAIAAQKKQQFWIVEKPKFTLIAWAMEFRSSQKYWGKLAAVNDCILDQFFESKTN